MRTLEKTHIIHIAVAAAALVLAAAPAAHAQRDAEFDTTAAFGPRGWAEITVPRGEIVVTTWSEPRVRVRANAGRSDVRFEIAGSQLTVGLRGSAARSGDTRVEVTVPVGTRVGAYGQSSDISVRGTKGRLVVNTLSGDVTVDDASDVVQLSTLSGELRASHLSGDITVSAVSGDVRLSDATGDIEATSVSGEVELRNVTTKRLRANTTSGDITYDGSLDADGRYTLASTSGDLNVTIPADAGAHVMLKTFSGDIESAWPITLAPGTHDLGVGSGKRLTFDIGRGSASLSVETFSGDITLKQRGR